MDHLPIDALEVGRVIEAYGVKGGIKLHPFSKTADGLLRVKQWYLKSVSGEVRQFTVDTAKWHADVVTATLMGMNNRDLAHELRAWTVWVSQAALPKTETDEYYWQDLIACKALAQDGSELGSIIDMSETGVHAVLHIDCGVGFETCLIPFVKAYVGEVDLVNKTVQTQWQRDWLTLQADKPLGKSQNKMPSKKRHDPPTKALEQV